MSPKFDIKIIKPLVRVRPRIEANKLLVEEPPQTRRLPDLHSDRYEPCLHLHKAGIPYKIWSVCDILQLHGSRKQLGRDDLEIIVNNTEDAARVLGSHGYLRTQKGTLYNIYRKVIRLVSLKNVYQTFDVPGSLEANPTFISALINSEDLDTERAHYHEHDAVSIPGVYLLSAAESRYHLLEVAAPLHMPKPEPQLHEYFDWAATVWLDTRQGRFSGPVGPVSQVLIELVEDLDIVWTTEFEKKIRKEHRQLLLDLMWWKQREGHTWPYSLLAFIAFTIRMRTREKTIRDRILTGKHVPKPNAALVRKRPSTPFTLWIPVATEGISKYDANHIKRSLPKLTWLVESRLAGGHVVVSLNIPFMHQTRRDENQKKSLEVKDDKGKPLEFWREDAAIYYKECIPDRIRFPPKKRELKILPDRRYPYSLFE
ncbi:hypothetical protein ASPWEDRAFT_174663 [Aspergillus wentii DTO 134E9]|uniref:Uncharacterized protein n=1 Tax=Aspergillus wentii DTO 134E9 TaxID=1073089 RepID=A0A1L9REE8_ASPWE|nr:uncharacterized protein ASPWEDRAFT_174663 [Aspergillus wentii DTO 134E9]KAI9933501.1 hypothetical protein MW887_007974 [Aspergillus wentii]OJJ33247.1 hypothetical protein ASPWEDRAFT_174663 [Aspergillus wentii DTO 134E9]